MQVVEQYRDRSGLFDDREVLARHVLDERQLERAGSVERVIDQRRDRREPGDLRGAPAPLAGDDLEPDRHAWTNDDRLQHSTLADRTGEEVERGLVEMLARLRRVRVDVLDRDLA